LPDAQRSLLLLFWCARRTYHDRQSEKKHEASSYHGSLAGFASHVPPPWKINMLTSFRDINIGKCDLQVDSL
jgi:hypothetical protein